jgi:hypothetical protein
VSRHRLLIKPIWQECWFGAVAVTDSKSEENRVFE